MVFDKIRWGILGTGHIANTFAAAIASLDDAVVQAVGSRTQKSADAFSDKYSIANRHGSYEALTADPEVDAIYIATLNSLHMDNSILCLEAGKAVLCEKPFCINRAQSENVLAVAKKQQRFIMEAMWTRFIPALQQAMAWIDEGAIGEVRMVQANFGFRADDAPLFDPALGGGALLDVGIYPITLAHMAFRKAPTEIRSLSYLGRNGVDEQSTYLLGYEGGGLAMLGGAIQTNTPYDGYIMGTDGMITIHDSFWNATKVSLKKGDEVVETKELPLHCNGYEYEAMEVHRCLREGKLESDIMPHQTTLDLMETLDTIRADWGLKYPME
ncbi:MAG: Gfo/Idh/MocA family oxidoreductase [Candidatus Hydrogenedentes bacterium]|nr:Gfo/Idh/MocA family oxidoreductase [Candidatus Hydrogenedentota bacterium]